MKNSVECKNFSREFLEFLKRIRVHADFMLYKGERDYLTKNSRFFDDGFADHCRVSVLKRRNLRLLSILEEEGLSSGVILTY